MESGTKQDLQNNLSIYPLVIAPYLWQRILIYPVFVGLLGLTLLTVLIALQVHILSIRILLVVFGWIFLKGSWISQVLARYSNHIAIVDTGGITIKIKNDSTFYPWDELAGFRDRRIAQIIELYVGNTRIFAIDYMTKDFRKFYECLSQNLNKL